MSETSPSIPLNTYRSLEDRRKQNDANDMRNIDRPQQLHRQFNKRSLVGFTVTLGATWPYAIVSTPLSLANGGPAGAIWTFVVAMIGFGAVVASLAHAASLQPYTGGPYHWVSVFARKIHQRILSYIVGWLEIIGWVAGTAGTAYFVGYILLGIVGLFHPTYSIQPWQGTLACIGVTLLGVLVNHFVRAFRLLKGLVLTFSIISFFCFVIILLVLGPRKQVSETFFDIQDSQGWGSKGLAALVGMLGPIITLIGADSTSHLAEETRNARKIVPQAMLLSVAIGYTCGFIMTVIIMVVSTGYDEDLAAQVDNAGIAIIYNATQSLVATKVMTIVLLFLLFWGLTNQITATSRLIWAFARDGGLPCHTWLERVSASNVPHGAVVLTFICTAILVLFPLASTIALNIITSFSIGGLSMAYLICICVMMDWRFRRDDKPIPRVDESRFLLPRWAIDMANAIAVLFLILATVMLCFPAAPNPTPTGMNWTCVLLPGTIFYALIYYYSGGGKIYVGPVARLRQVTAVSE
ncbi:hypothetical protein LTR12_013868 [Friedmanniomyces endolithicus]|nr:hypothetical protein LTR12_013868 [Friedmanniomyces endolithicus]